MFRAKNYGILTPEVKAKWLISKTISKVSRAVLVLFICVGIFGTFEPFLNIVKNNLQLFWYAFYATSIALFVFNIILFFKLVKRDADLKFLRTSWFVICTLLIAEASLVAALLKAIGIIDYEIGKIAFIFAIPSVIFWISSYIVKYSNFDFTRIGFAISILAIVLIMVRLVMFFTVNSTQTIKNVSTFAIVVYTGFLLYNLGIIKKHYQFLKAMNSEADNTIGDESLKFIYLYSINLFNIFVRMVIELLIIMSKR